MKISGCYYSNSYGNYYRASRECYNQDMNFVGVDSGGS